MKKLFLIVSLLIPGISMAEQVIVDQFKYLNSNESSVILDPAEAQDMLNTEITPGGKSVKKRQGYGAYKTLSPSAGLHGGYHAFSATGSDYQLWGSSVSLYGITSDGTPVQIVSSATLNTTWDCVDTQGNSYCVNSSRNAYIKTDGATLGSWQTSPLGTMIESTPDRVVVAGVAASPNTLFVSQSNVFTNFVTGLNTTDPFNEVIAAPGSHLTHIRWGCQRLLWWKDQSFGFFDFDDQYSNQIQIVSDNIGTFDNTSAIDPGGSVWFRGQDGHIYRYDCSGLEKMTIDITPQIQSSGRRTTNSWTQTSGSDFNSGSTVYLDTTTSPGDVKLQGYHENFVSLSSWTLSVYGAISSFTVVGGVAVSHNATVSDSSLMQTNRGLVNYSSSTIYQSVRYAFDSTSNNSIALELCLGPTTNSGITPANYCVTVFPAATNSTIRLRRDTTILATGSVSSLDTSYHVLGIRWQTTGALDAYFDGVSALSTTDTIYNVPSFSSATIRCSQNAGGGGHNCSISNFDESSSTGTLYTAWKNAPSWSAWSTFNPTYADSGGSNTFFIRSSTSPQSVSNSTITWVSQPANAQVATSTSGIYFQVRDDFAITAASQTPTLSDVTVNWFEGNASDQAYMLYFDNAIWESVAYGTGVSSNTYTFRYDLINQGWAPYNFGSGGMLIQGNKLYFGSVSDGNIFQFGNSPSDNGNAINAFWRSKTFSGKDAFMQSQFTNIDVFTKKDTGSTLTSTYTLDNSTSTAYTISLSTASSFAQSRKLIPSGKLGYVFDEKISDFSATSQWELLGFRVTYTQLPYRPTSP